jgi:hypothetical protein
MSPALGVPVSKLLRLPCCQPSEGCYVHHQAYWHMCFSRAVQKGLRSGLKPATWPP